MTIFTFANNVSTTLASAFSSSATSFTLSSSAHLPASIPAGQYLVVTLLDAATKSNYEVIYVGTVTGATCSNLLRGQEGTTALSWLTGDFAYNPPTMGQQSSFGQLAASNNWTGNNTFSNPVGVANATTTGQAVPLGQAEATFAAINGSASQTFNVAQATSSTQAIPLGQLASQFPSSLAINGFKKYPDPNSPTGYFIEQWGNGLYPTQLTTTGQNFPIAFPNVCLNFTCSLGASISLTTFNCCGGEPSSNSQFSITVSAPTPGADGVYWRAKGY